MAWRLRRGRITGLSSWNAGTEFFEGLSQMLIGWWCCGNMAVYGVWPDKSRRYRLTEVQSIMVPHGYGGLRWQGNRVDG